MRITSFTMGVAVGAAAVALAPRLRPLALEIATSVYKLIDGVMVRVAQGREDLSDLLAEARARARAELRTHMPARWVARA